MLKNTGWDEYRGTGPTTVTANGKRLIVSLQFTPKHLPPTAYDIANNRKLFAFPCVNVNDINVVGIMPHWMAGASK
jgi:hypothetical protein